MKSVSIDQRIFENVMSKQCSAAVIRKLTHQTNRKKVMMNREFSNIIFNMFSCIIATWRRRLTCLGKYHVLNLGWCWRVCYGLDTFLNITLRLTFPLKPPDLKVDTCLMIWFMCLCFKEMQIWHEICSLQAPIKL